MDTKSLLTDIATTLFQQKGYMGVGITEILKASNVTKGALYHHFPNGKEELLMACLQSMAEAITSDTEDIFNRYPTTQEATCAMIDKLAAIYEREGTITSCTFSSIFSEMGALSESVRFAYSDLYEKIQRIYKNKLVMDGHSEESANSMALMMTASIEGGIMLCITKNSSEPLKIISEKLSAMIHFYSNE